jgi:hypothetical protein
MRLPSLLTATAIGASLCFSASHSTILSRRPHGTCAVATEDTKRTATANNIMLYIIRFATDSISLTSVVVCTHDSVVNELVNISLRHRKMTDTRARGFWLNAAPQAHDLNIADWIASTKIRGA